MAGRRQRAIVQLGVEAADLAAQRFPEFADSLASVRSVRVTIVTLPSNRSADAYCGPRFSEPASGWLPTK
jgi:hypothetical protein